MASIKEIEDISAILRRDVLEMTSSAGSGHPSSCLSSADLISALFFNEMAFDVTNPSNPDNDEFVLSKGHAAPILYSALKRAGCIDEDLLKLRKIDSPLEGHPMPSSLGWIHYASGSLGQGISIALGMALAQKLQKRKSKTFVLTGDSELAEGSNYEAFQLASYYEVNNLVVISDINRLGQRGETLLGHNMKLYQERLESFGFLVLIVDGHNVKQIISALEKARKSTKPVAILAKTIKGKGVNFMEDKNGWHGKALNEEELKKALKQIPEVSMPQIQIKSPEVSISNDVKLSKLKPCLYEIGQNIATRESYGKSLSKLAESDSRIIALDAEVSNSTHSEEVKHNTPKQFLECFIAEQNMIGMAQGLSIKGFNTYASSFAAFLTRAHDQIRMASLANANVTLCGSHCGVSIGEDGASQMGLDDISMFRAMPNTTIFYPSDAVSTEKIVQLSSTLKGIKYIRTTRPKCKVIYDNNEKFEVGDFKIIKQYSSPIDLKNYKKNKKKVKSKINSGDHVVLIGAGITLHECLSAHQQLKSKEINAAVIDLYCIKPLDINKLKNFILEHGKKVVIAEDHFKEGGIGEMLSAEFANTDIKVKTLSIKRVPHSGTMLQLLDKYQINSSAIVETAKELLDEE
jgi:transketolase